MNTVELSKFARDVRDFHELSGLSWKQIGRALGVSARTAQWWSTGYAKTVTQAAERVFLLLQQVVALNLATPAQRRTALLNSERSFSIFSEWVHDARSNSQVIQVSSWNLFNQSEMSGGKYE